MESEGKQISLEELRQIHRRKTGDLITSSCRIGSILAGAAEKQISVLSDFGAHLGMAFQIKDDILDIDDTTDEGKKKATFPSILGLEGSRTDLLKETDAALECLKGFDEKAEALRSLARYASDRRT
jgi:geranylgeranyl diphosphate synthase type II